MGPVEATLGLAVGEYCFATVTKKKHFMAGSVTPPTIEWSCAQPLKA